MGASGPKRRLGPAELLAMEEAVHAAIEECRTSDRVLDTLLEVTITSLLENRPLFPNPLDEPLMYRLYFRKWVEDSLEVVGKLQRAQKDNSSLRSIREG